MTKAGNWFRFGTAAADASVAEIHIIDFIGDWIDDAINRAWGEHIGVTARSFVEQLSKLPAAVQTINVHINSPGGDVQGGINIANALRAETAKGRTVVTYVDGIAASIASVIAMAGSRVVMADNALMMIHDPWGFEIGNAAELRKSADVLDTMRDQIVATYRWHSTLEPDAIAGLMAAETWMSADEAIAQGFATEKVEGLKAAALITRASLKTLKVPAEYQARVEALVQPEPTKPVPAAAAEVARLSAEAGASASFIAEIVGANLTLDDAKARIATDKTSREAADQQARAMREAAEARSTDIRAACALAKLPELADAYVAGGMPLDQVRAQLTVMAAKLDKVEIDTTLVPAGGGPAPSATVALADAYRKLNAKKKE